jgi:CubicO group peptidase (beta-lactamase class C family)
MLRRSFLALAASPLLRGQSEIYAEIDRLVTIEIAAQKLPAVSLAITVDENTIRATAEGFADLEHRVGASAETVFRTASIAKPITAAAVMLLVERGRLDLDADIRTYVPELPEKPWRVTLRQLLGHLGGIRWYRDDAETNSTRHYYALADALAAFAGDPLVHEPSTKYLYSSYGFVLAGLAAERAAGRPLAEFLRESVFAALQMNSTRLDDAQAIIPNRARGYMLGGDGTMRNAPYLDTSGRWPGGGLVSTAADLVRFAAGIRKLLQPSSIDLMWTPQRTRDGGSTGYGLGWGIAPFDGRRRVTHGGAQSGFVSVLHYLPDDEIALAILINRSSAQHTVLAESVLRLVLAGVRPASPSRSSDRRPDARIQPPAAPDRAPAARTTDGASGATPPQSGAASSGPAPE